MLMFKEAPVVFGSKFKDIVVLGGAHPDEYYSFSNTIHNEFGGKFNCSIYGTEPGFCQANGTCADYYDDMKTLVIQIDAVKYSLPPKAISYEIEEEGKKKCRIGVVYHSAFT